MTYLSPLAYLLGLEGVALLRGIRDGIGDQEFVEARIAEIRELLDDPALLKAGARMPPWAESAPTTSTAGGPGSRRPPTR